jgi:hypothetical protein
VAKRINLFQHVTPVTAQVGHLHIPNVKPREKNVAMLGTIPAGAGLNPYDEG